jgi:phosphoribosylformylglycinamidine synthase
MGKLKENDLKTITKQLGREPNEIEQAIFSVMWSEHCSYRTSKPFLKKLFSKSKRKIVGQGENAGVLDIDDGDFVAFKMESHNHPSAIEPYQGAATGIGGILRDIFTMGARPVACSDPLRFGHLSDPHCRHLLEEVVRGISDYGNSVGVPTIAGETQFDPSYKINCVVNVFALGIGRTDELIRGVASGRGNLILYFGSKTGRDGVDGAYFASDPLSEKSKEDRPSVQIANPFQEKKVIEACLKIAKKRLVVSMQDMGAAGLTSSSVEMASRGDVGIELDLSKVPKRQSDVTPWEMMLSETQERMLAVIEQKKLDEIIEIFKQEEIEWAIIGKITDTKRMILKEGEKTLGDIPISLLLEEVPPANDRIKIENKESDELMGVKTGNIKNVIEKILSSNNINSKHWIYEQYDYRVGNDTIKIPGDGFSVLRINKKDKALSITNLGLEDYTYLNPYKGGYNTVAKSALEHLIGGFEPIGITDCLNFGNPENDVILGQFSESLRGMSSAAELFKVPIVSGNVSFYNESEGGAIKPLLEIGMIGFIKKLDRIKPNYLINNDSCLYQINLSDSSINPSLFSKEILNIDHGKVPKFNSEKLKKFIEILPDIFDLYSSARVQSRGGNFVTLFKMGLRNNLSFNLPNDNINDLFSEGPGLIIFEISAKNKGDFLYKTKDFSPVLLGKTLDNGKIILGQKGFFYDQLKDYYFDSFENSM